MSTDTEQSPPSAGGTRTLIRPPAQAAAARTPGRPDAPPLSGAAIRHALAVRFRIPGRTDPVPSQRRLALLSTWAGVLGFGGSIIALRLLVNLCQTDGGWYRPTIAAIGGVGLLATVGAFTSIHRRRLPWMLLSVGTVALVAAFAVTV
jgi:hypothetical protein